MPEIISIYQANKSQPTFKMKTLLVLLTFGIILQSCSQNVELREDQLVAMAMKDGICGYVDTDGDFIIEPTYTEALSFSNGLACVILGGKRTTSRDRDYHGGQTAFINHKNEVVFEIDLDGTSFFHGGRAIIMKDKRYAFIDNTGNVIAEGFTGLRPFYDGLAAATKDEDGEKKAGFINTKGEWEVPLSPYVQFDSYRDGLAFYKYERKCGFLNNTGAEVIPAEYRNATNFSEGLAAVKQSNEGYGYIDKSGNLKIAYAYYKANNFNEGFAAVMSNKTGKWGYINKKGELITEFIYKKASEFSNGLACVQQGDTLGYINTKGEWAFEPDLDWDSVERFKNGYAIFSIDGKYGAINTEGDIVIKPKFDRLRDFVFINEDNKTL
jgi:hypothetical protein